MELANYLGIKELVNKGELPYEALKGQRYLKAEESGVDLNDKE